MNDKELIKTARFTGLWYFLLAVSGILGFMVFHSKIFVSSNPAETLKNIIEQESIARTRLLLECGIVVFQGLTAVWFYKLFKEKNDWVSWTLSAWGLMNSVVILISAIAMASAISIANSSELIIEDKIVTIQIFQSIISNAWGVGGLFFGLWLFPMGYLVVQTKLMPLWLGRIIILGGIGYLLSTLLTYLDIDLINNRIIILPATIGEFWMIGYLLIYGVRK